MSEEPGIPTGLRREWAAVATASIALIVVATAALSVALDAPLFPGSSLTDPPDPIRWLGPTAIVLGYELWFCLRYLQANRPAEPRADGLLNPRLGLPNLVTLGRGGLFAALAGFGALAPRPGIVWVPAILYGAGCALDAVDGFLARRYDRQTVLGAKLDMAIDTTGFLVAPVVAVLWGQLPVWYLSLSAARYLFKFGRGLRRRRGLPVSDLPPSAVRRPLAGLQMAFITLALAPVFDPVTIRTLAIAVLTPSLAVFVRDYLVVSGRLTPRRE